VAVTADQPRATTHFAFFHPSGNFGATVHLAQGAAHWEIEATSFVTPVRLIMLGNLVTPRPTHHP
jgi:hypothetical protein